MSVHIGDPAPAFELNDQQKEPVSLDTIKGKNSLIVFIPFPFTGICEGELCAIRDGLAELNALDANVIAVTCDTIPSNAKWSEINGFEFPVLSDFWPHGETTRAYGAFNEALGCANRVTYVLDDEGVVCDIVASEGLSTAREFDLYTKALAAI